MSKWLWSIATLMAALAAPSHASTDHMGFGSYQPTLDVTHERVCREVPRTKDERLAHSRKLAEVYFLNFQQDRESGRNYGWYGQLFDPKSVPPDEACVTANVTIVVGAFDPLGKPHQIPSSSTAEKRNHSALTGEQRAYYAEYKDWKSLPGTLVVVPLENAVYYRFAYGGHDRQGRYNSQWEVNSLTLDERGKITHVDMWNDTLGIDEALRTLYGKGLKEIGGTSGYISTTESTPK